MRCRTIAKQITLSRQLYDEKGKPVTNRYIYVEALPDLERVVTTGEGSNTRYLIPIIGFDHRLFVYTDKGKYLFPFDYTPETGFLVDSTPIRYFGKVTTLHILKAGGTVVPLNVLLKGREVAYHLGDSDAKAYFCFEGTAELPIGQEGYTGFQGADGCEHFFVITAALDGESPFEGIQTFGQALGGQDGSFETVATDEDDTAVILYTSGTTGQPKGAELRHRNMRDNALAGKDTLRRRPGQARHLPVRAAAVPLLRPDRHPERRRRRSAAPW